MKNIYCPCCLNTKIKKKFISYNNISYSICSACGTSYQNPVVSFDYEGADWEKLKDPDNNIRNLKAEKDFKIKNWYGDTIDYLNQKKGGEILDIGCGLGYFLSALNK